MINELVALLLEESKWLAAAMGFAFVAVAILLYRYRPPVVPVPRLILSAMNLFFGITIGIMAFGHLLAVSTKLALGRLEGSILLFYTIGIALAAPSGWLIYHARQLLASREEHRRATLVLNGWLAITLLVLGVHNLPLAAPAFFNIAYSHLHSRRVAGWAIIGLAIAVHIGLFIGSVIFWASGQSFEQFQGME